MKAATAIDTDKKVNYVKLLEDATEDQMVEYMTDRDRIQALEDRAAYQDARYTRMKKFVNEVVAFANGLEKRIEALEKNEKR
jgi:hypothetical protein